MNKPPILIGLKLQNLVQHTLLAIITLATIIAVAQDTYAMFTRMEVKISELLMLFIYLEIITMVVIYMDSGELPVRMPLYIAMVALARYLILNMESMGEWKMATISGSILMISVAVLVVRFGHIRYPYEKPSNHRNP